VAPRASRRTSRNKIAERTRLAADLVAPRVPERKSRNKIARCK
jgi:hypothetical protein